MEKKLKICVYAIAKDEEKFVKRFCESAKDADLILIADTGSKDDTVGLAEKAGATVFDICVTPWRFDKARDAALALVPKDMDVCISLDLDEVLMDGWREEIEKVWTAGTTRLSYVYDWGHNRVFKTEKIHARAGYSWHHPCHEYLRIDSRITQKLASTEKLIVKHLPDEMKSRGTYLELLKMSVQEDPHCPRNSFYYARELFFYGQAQEAIAEAKRYLALPTAVWHHERAYAMRIISKCCEVLGQMGEAEIWAMKGAIEGPGLRESWCALATLFYGQRRWSECFAAAERALAITHKELVYTTDPVCWGALPYDLAGIAAWNMGLRQAALRYSQIAAELDPDDPRLTANVKQMEIAVNPTLAQEFKAA
jgi:tetratricopeptide (TPR) repeat protein